MEYGYNGNPLLKKSDLEIEWTPELIKEYAKCMHDPVYFAERYIKIVHVDRGLIPIELYDYQKEMIWSVAKNRFVVSNASRQSGKTTTAVCIILHYILFNEHKKVALLANKAMGAIEILSRVQLAYEALPTWLQQGVVTWNKGSMELENGCKVIAAASSSSAIRGQSISLLYLDETAFVPNWDEFFASVYPTISSGKESKVFMTSTPNGLNHFWKTCKEAQEDVDPATNLGKNGYEYHHIPWHRVPGRDEKWKLDTLASIGGDVEKFNQEFNCDFLGSSGTLISGAKLKELSFSNPIAKNEGISQFEVPVAGASYVLIADVSRGKGLDYSTFSIIDSTSMPYKQVCTFRDNLIGPVDFAAFIHRMATYYNEAQVLIEINDIGGQVSDTLFMEYGYENLIFTENAGRQGKRVSGGFGRSVDRGIRTTKSVKSIGCSILKLLIEQNQLLLRDIHTINELSRFSRKGSSYEAESGAHDDMVMTLVLFAWLSDQTFFRDLTDIHTLSRLKERTDEQIAEDLLPFGFMDNGFAYEEAF